MYPAPFACPGGMGLLRTTSSPHLADVTVKTPSFMEINPPYSFATGDSNLPLP